jgi:hypothetical protein
MLCAKHSMKWSAAMANTDAYWYRKQAEEARQEAARAVSSLDKEEWLRVAEEWTKLAQDAEKRSRDR